MTYSNEYTINKTNEVVGLVHRKRGFHTEVRVASVRVGSCLLQVFRKLGGQWFGRNFSGAMICRHYGLP